jgi:hypothetical protein
MSSSAQVQLEVYDMDCSVDIVSKFFYGDRGARELAEALVTKPKSLLVDGLKEYFDQVHNTAVEYTVVEAVADMLIADWHFANAYTHYDS